MLNCKLIRLGFDSIMVIFKDSYQIVGESAFQFLPKNIESVTGIDYIENDDGRITCVTNLELDKYKNEINTKLSELFLIIDNYPEFRKGLIELIKETL